MFALTIAASNLKIAVPDQFDALVRAFQLLVDRENKALLAAGQEGIMGAQGRTNLAIQVRDRLVNCLEQRKTYQDRK